MFITKREHDAILAAERAVATGWKELAADYKAMLLDVQSLLAKVHAPSAVVLTPEDQPKTVREADVAAVAARKAKAGA